MANKEQLNYDAFISYRHSELDTFVAKTIHKELERFQLPQNMVKARGKDQKSKIQRVFRDQDELPISADLSESIQEALDHSDFLVVICSPRLKESVWCKNEVQSFIARNGREKVLAVLIEGEPAESFPEEITSEKKVTIGADGSEVVEVVNVEPLAADVRGKNKNEIKKKIKEEIVRLAAAIFDCNYDEIKQRHREQIMRSRMRIATMITAASLLFGGVFFYQSVQIQKQGDMISEQYDQIQSQYTEIELQYEDNLVKQTEMVAIQAEDYYKKGNIESAKQLIIDTYEMADGNLPDRAKANLRYILAEILRKYDNGYRIAPYMNLTLPYEITEIASSNTGKYITAFATNGDMVIWDSDTFEKVYEDSTDYINPNGECVLTSCYDLEDNIYYLGTSGLTGVSCVEGKVIWHLDIDTPVTFAGAGNKRIIVLGKYDAYVVSRDDGHIINTIHLDDNCTTSSFEGQLLMLSEDGSKMFMVRKSSGNMEMISIDLSDYSIINRVNVDAEHVTAGCPTDAGVLMIATKKEGDSFVLTIDEETCSVINQQNTDFEYTKMFFWNKMVIACSESGIEYYDLNSYKLVKSIEFGSEITEVRILNDDTLWFFLADGSRKDVFPGGSSYISQDAFGAKVSDVKQYVYLKQCTLVLPKESNMMTVYNVAANPEAEYIGYDDSVRQQILYRMGYGYGDLADNKYSTEIEDDEIRIYKGKKKVKKIDTDTRFIRDVYVDNSGDFIIVQRGDYYLEVRSFETYEVLLTIKGDEFTKVYDGGKDYFIVGDSDYAYVINRNSFICEAKVQGFYAYDEDENAMILSLTLDGFGKVPFYSFEELMEEVEN